MTHFFELFLQQNNFKNILAFVKYDDEGYPVEDNAEYSDGEDLDSLYDDEDEDEKSEDNLD